MSNSSIEKIQITTLANGLRVISEHIPYVKSASIGIFIGIGSRDESDEIRGISHFIEHMMFKGTPTRTARQIADEIESRGGQLNAFTDKEMTSYQVRVLSEDTPLAVEILTDMLRNSLHDSEEMEREKRVVIEEIKMYEDSPEETVHDIFEQTLWQSHPLGKSIIGSEKTVSGLTRQNLTDYIAAQYLPDRIILSAVGLVDHDEVVKLAEVAFANLLGTAPVRILEKPQSFSEKKEMSKRDIEQVHFCLGNAAFDKHDEARFSLSILNNVLGGNMSSRLFQEVREKRGLAYAIGSYPRTYQDGGHFCVYGGTSPETYEQVLELTKAEFGKIRKDGILEDELSKAKTQVRGALVLGLESMNARMNRYGESLLSYGRVMPIEEVLTKYEAVTNESIGKVAQIVLNESSLTLTAVGPFDA